MNGVLMKQVSLGKGTYSGSPIITGTIPRTMQQQPNEYDFIMNDPSGGKGRKFGGLTTTNKFAFVGLISAILVVVMGVLYFALNAGKPNNEAQLISLAQQQTELIRVAGLGLKDARETQSRQLATTTLLNITSDLNNLKPRLAAAKVKLKDAALGAGKNSKTDQALEKAKENNQFDTVFLKTLQDELVDYQKNMNAAYKDTANIQLKAELKKQYENASLIINVKPEE